LEDGLRLGTPECPLMWEWHDSKYWGAAHGVTGILHVLLRVYEECIAHSARWQQALLGTIDYLVAEYKKEPSGIFKSQATGSTKLIQWCHGNPGLVFLLCRAHALFPGRGYDTVAKHAGEVVWPKGMLRKGGGLCHGVSGNAYVFLALYRMTREKKYLHRAVQFALAYGDSRYSNNFNTPDAPSSLFEGMSGMICLLADLINDPLQARFPCFEDI